MPRGALEFPVATLTFPSNLQREETPAPIEVILPADVLFDFDKADIRAAAETTLWEQGGDYPRQVARRRDEFGKTLG